MKIGKIRGISKGGIGLVIGFYFNPRFFFSIRTCASTGDAQMEHTWRRVVSL